MQTEQEQLARNSLIAWQKTLNEALELLRANKLREATNVLEGARNVITNALGRP